MNSICAPALLFLILSLFSILIMISQSFDILSIVVKIFFVAIWTWFLNFLCSQGYTIISWFLVIIPFIFFILMLVFTYQIFKKMSADQLEDLLKREQEIELQRKNNQRYFR